MEKTIITIQVPTENADNSEKKNKSGGSGHPFWETYSPIIFFCALLIYLEVAFHLLMYQKITASLLCPLLFSLFLGALLGLICHLFSRRVNRILFIVLGVFFCVLFCAEVIYQNVFHTYFLLFGVLGVAGQALDFMSIILSTIQECFLYMVVLFFVPVILTVTSAFWFCDLSPNRKMRTILGSLVTAAASYALMMIFIVAGDTSIGTAYDYYFNNLSADGGIETLGVDATTWLNGLNTLTGRTGNAIIYTENQTKPEEEGEEEEEEPVEEEVVIDTSPNILDIDFDKIIEDSGNDKDVKKLCEYMEDRAGTNKNEYTGMFEGYNLIWLTAEGFSGYCMSEEWTPNLWKMASEGFVFKHYYTPEYYGSTTGGEWSNLTGTVPNDGDYVSMSQSGRVGLNMLFTAGRQSVRLGYRTTGWHNNTYTYYYRDVDFPNMGYEWYGSGNGYEPEISSSSGKPIWPQSDVMLIEQSFPEYAADEPFMTYYMTVSGHMDYTWGGNTMSKRNEEAVREYAEKNGYDYSENTLGYLAAQKELDKAIGTLLDYLDKTGLADRTLIVMSCDHVPYDDMDVLNDIAGKKLSAISKYKNALFIYSPSMEEPVVVDKYCCQIDMLATVSNLMGWDYDSRMLVGEDILSDSEQFVMFTGLSYITDKVIYNAKSGKVKNLTDEEVDDDYLQSMKEKAKNWYTISDLLFSTDFFKYVEDQMPEVSQETKDKIKELREGKTVDLDAIKDPEEEEEDEEKEDSDS